MKTIAYFVHDLSDPSVHRRVRMLAAGGAAVRPIGFHRSKAPVGAIDGIPPISLGQTGDGQLASRVLSVAKASAKLGSLADVLRGADAIVARNLETLVLAVRARKRYAPQARLIYECLDIHRLLLSKGAPGALLRSLETRLWRELDLLITSSPAFIENYFLPRNFPAPIRLVENKVLLFDEREPLAPQARRQGPPWRIGWFGMIRCRRSLDILSALAREGGGAIEVLIRGRPSDAVFTDFEAAIARMPHVRFDGPYRAADLPALYAQVHFAWAVDYFEQGRNSLWLLPNRLYESTLFGAAAIGQAGVESGAWLARHGVGVVLEEPLEDKLDEFFHRLDDDGYQKLADGVRALPRDDLAIDRADCLELVEALCGK